MPPRAKKDPDAPKNAKSAYMYFVQDKLKEIKAANPDMKQSDIMKQAGAEWRGLSDAEKAPYNKLNAKDKERASQEKLAYENRNARKAAPKKPVPKKPAKQAQQAEEEEAESAEVEEGDSEFGGEDSHGVDEEGEDESP